MCGGEGSRLESPHEKPLHPIRGAPMIERVLKALAASRAEAIYAAVSPNAPETRDRLRARDGVSTIETAGEGYVTDLLALLEHPEIETPLLTVAADLPLLEGPVVDRILASHGGRDASRTVCVPAALKRRLGVGLETTLAPRPHLAPTGVNVVGGTDESMIDVRYDSRLAVNVNRRADAHIAANYLRRRRDGGDDPCA